MGGFQVSVVVLEVGLWVSTSTGGSGASVRTEPFQKLDTFKNKLRETSDNLNPEHPATLLTFLVLGDDWVAKLDKLSTSDLVDSLDSEVVFSSGDEVLHSPAHFVLSRHHVDIGPPASLPPLHKRT